MIWSRPPGSRPRSPKGSQTASSSSLTTARTPPSMRTPRSSTSARWNSCASTPDNRQRLPGADVVVVLVDHMYRRLFRGGPAGVGADVGRDEVGLLVEVGTLVLGHQPARPWIGAVVEQQPVDVLIRYVFVTGEGPGFVVVL